MFRTERKNKKERKKTRKANTSAGWAREWMDTGGKKFERVKMFLAWCIIDALRANIMRFYSAIHIKHRKQQKAGGRRKVGGRGRSAIKMPAPKHIISTPSSGPRARARAFTRTTRRPRSLTAAPRTLASFYLIRRIIFHHSESVLRRSTRRKYGDA